MKEFSNLDPFIIVKSLLDFRLDANENNRSICNYKYTKYEYQHKYLIDFFTDNKEQLVFDELSPNRYSILKGNCNIGLDDFDKSRSRFKFNIVVPFEIGFYFRVDDISPFIRKNKLEFAISDF